MKSTKIFSIMAAAVVFGQIALGATVITEKLHAVLVTAHLGLGLVLYSSLVFIIVNTYYTNQRLKSQSSSANSVATSSMLSPASADSSSSEKKPAAGYFSNKSNNGLVR
jgi:heme A synthase